MHRHVISAAEFPASCMLQPDTPSLQLSQVAPSPKACTVTPSRAQASVVLTSSSICSSISVISPPLGSDCRWTLIAMKQHSGIVLDLYRYCLRTSHARSIHKAMHAWQHGEAHHFTCCSGDSDAARVEILVVKFVMM